MKTFCIFDLDGTTADTLRSLAFCTNRALFDVGLPPQPIKAFRRYAGDGVNRMVERASKASGGSASQTELAKELFEKYFKKDFFYGVETFEGLPETLKELKKQGFRLAVLSNKPQKQAVEVVHKLYGKKLFDCVVGQSKDVPCKPSPVGVQYILRQFDEKPENGLYFGDTDTDMKTGSAAGLFTIGVLWGFRGRDELLESGADALIGYPSQMGELLETLKAKENG